MLAEKGWGGTLGFCCAPGLTGQDIADILAILPADLASPLPIVAMGGKYAAQREGLVLASESLLHILGVKNLGGLSRLLLSGKGGFAKQFTDFASALILDAEPRTVNLRLRIGRLTRTITWRGCCVRMEGAPPLFAAAMLDVAEQNAEAFRAPPHRTQSDAGERGDDEIGRERPAQMGLPARRGRASLEMELRRQKAEFRELCAILDTATDGVAVLDGEGRILTLNHSGEALFGTDQNEVAGTAFTDLIAPESRELAASYFEGLKSGGDVSLLNQGREVTVLARQGGTIPVFMTLGKIGGGTGAGGQQQVRFCAILRDLTHWKKVERELEEARKDAERANALKSDFLAKVSHEIRTPLNAILGFAEVMLEERFGPIRNRRYKDYLGDIRASGALVMSLVNDLLDLSKIEAGKMEFSFSSIDANRIVAECVSIMQPQARAEQVVMRLSLAPALPNILVDERSLRQIVLNLLSNAVKFNRPGGRVTVSTALADGGSAVIRIRDTGTGMSEDDIGASFEPFRRLATTKPSAGTGLGLPLTKALAEANYAALTLKSKLAEGTLAEVVFPPARVLAE